MKKLQHLPIITISLLFDLIIVSCNNQKSGNNVQTNNAALNKVAQVDSSKYTTSIVDNKRDPSCGMPLTAGIGDTLHYKNKVLGFCSKECKDQFLNAKVKDIKAAQMK